MLRTHRRSVFHADPFTHRDFSSFSAQVYCLTIPPSCMSAVSSVFESSLFLFDFLCRVACDAAAAILRQCEFLCLRVLQLCHLRPAQWAGMLTLRHSGIVVTVSLAIRAKVISCSSLRPLSEASLLRLRAHLCLSVLWMSSWAEPCRVLTETLTH